MAGRGEPQTCGVSTSFYNIIVHGLGFTCLFTAFQTSSMFQSVVLEVQLGDANLGFQSLAVIYFVFAFAGFVSPPIVDRVGAKYGMAVGGIVYALFIGCFLKPMVWAILTGSVLLGLAASVIWTAQGNFFTQNSNDSNRGRLGGIFWAMLQSSLLIGNLVGYFVLKGGSVDTSDKKATDKFLKEAHLFYEVLFFAAIGGVCILFLTRQRPKVEQEPSGINADTVKEETLPVKEMIWSTVQLMCTFDMIMLIFIISYTGFSLTFWASQYPTLIAKAFKPRVTSLSGMIVGSAEIIGGITMGRLSDKAGRSTVIMLGMGIHVAAFFLIYYNFESGMLDKPSQPLALACSFLLGLGDSSFNTNLIAVLSAKYDDQSSQAFALYKGFQSLAAGVAFMYSAYHLAIQFQLLVLSVFLLISAFCFVRVERRIETKYSAYAPIE